MFAPVLLAALAWGQDAVRGEYVATAAGCVSCHTAPGGVPWAGGYPLETKFGTFYGTNLTPDPTHGIGGWSEADFARALREGKGPDGKPYWPAFPYPAFTNLTDQDVADVFAYLRTIPPDPRADTPHEPKGGYGAASVRAWRTFEFREGAFEPDSDESAEHNRGDYLVTAVGHCGECHTPRNGIGGRREGRELAGSDDEPEGGPNLTPHVDGLGGWTVDDFESLLTVGMKPDGDFVGGVMGDIVRDQTSKLTPEDRRAIATYLMAVKPLPSR